MKEIASVIAYDPETGAFTWRVSPSPHIAAGDVAGSIKNRDGYRQIIFRRRSYKAHRVAWLIMTGEWPEQFIDHINLDRSDNRWVNLRQATPSQNNANWRASGHLPKGVTIHRGGKYQAQIKVDGKNHYLGLFEDIDEAHAAYVAASIAAFGEFARAA